MRTRIILSNAFIACVCGVTLACTLGLIHPEDSDTPPVVELPDSHSLTPAKVIRIFDADTILLEVDGQKLRYQLLGANAPEFQPNAHVPKPFSIESKRFLEQLLLGESVYIQADPANDRDLIHRRIAYVFRAPDMLFVNLELVRQGYAKHDPLGMSIYNDVFHYYESKAQGLARGIWDPLVYQDRLPTPADEIAPEPVTRLNALPDAVPTNQPAVTTDSIESVPKKSSTSGDQDPIVFITKSGSKYHAKGCPHLTSSNKKTTREEVKGTHQACKTCKPDGER